MHEPDSNAVAYIVYKRMGVWLREDQPFLEDEGWLEDETGSVGDAPFHRTRLFFAEDAYRSREEVWEREAAWLDPVNTRIVPLYKVEGALEHILILIGEQNEKATI